MSFFYILSKIFNFFLHPLHWIIILLVVAYFTRKKPLKKWLRIIAVVVFLLFTNQALLNLAVNNWQPKPVNLTKKRYSAGIVLGGISVIDRFQHGYFWLAADRFIQTLSLYKQGIIKKIIVTGGNAYDELPTEADFITAEFIKCGVNAADIYTENNSKNTFENAVLTRKIIDTAHLKPPFVLVTSALHMNRASLVFNKAGIPVVAYPSNYEVVRQQLHFQDYVVPKIHLMETWNRFLKEITGIWVYRISGKL